MTPTGGRGPHAGSSQVSATFWNQPNPGHSTPFDTDSKGIPRTTALAVIKSARMDLMYDRTRHPTTILVATGRVADYLELVVCGALVNTVCP